ncbi:uncharacterized protein LOC135369820 [Ornithodoros turicata]|uniref:uncharacterized protein LOC135369820 n=1 Tax=Ornithodoros turicata TaxID=34597 RepID=UPI00313865FD
MATLEGLRRSIAIKLKDPIARYIRERDQDSGDVDSIVQQIRRSESWRKFQKSYLLSLSPDGATPEKNVYHDDADDEGSRSGSAFSMDSFGSESSYNRESTVLSPEQIHELCKLIVSPAPSSKLHAIDILSRVSNFETLVINDDWTQLECRLRTLLTHPTKVIKQETFRLYWTMMSEGGVVFQSAYKSLLAAVKNVVCCRGHGVKHRQQDGLSIVEVVNAYHRNLPSQWLKYPRSVVHYIVEETLTLMDDTFYDNFSRMWKTIASVDEHAEWLKIWLLEGESRLALMQMLPKRPNILLHAVQLVVNYKKYPELCERNISSHVYGCCILIHVLHYSGGRTLFNTLSSGRSRGKGWFEILVQVIQFVKVLSQCSYNGFDNLIQRLKATLEAIGEAVDDSFPMERKEILINHVLDFNKPVTNVSLHRNVLSECLKALSSTKRGLHIIQSTTYKGTKVIQNIVSLVVKTLESPKEHDLDVCTVNNLLVVCGYLVRHPGYFLTEGYRYQARLLKCVLDSYKSNGLNVTAGLDKLVECLLATSIGTALLNFGTVSEEYGDYVLRADIYKKLQYFSAHTTGTKTVDKLISEAEDHFWRLKQSHVECKVNPKDMCYAVICLLPSQRECRVIFAQNAEYCEDDIWSMLALLPSSYDIQEDEAVLSLYILKGLICCLKTYIFLEETYCITRRLEKIISDYRTDDGSIMLTELTFIALQIIERIKFVGNPRQWTTLTDFDLSDRFDRVLAISEETLPARSPTSAPDSSTHFKVSLKCASNGRKALEEFLNENATLRACEFESFFTLDRTERRKINDDHQTTTNAQKCGIEMTLKIGRDLGLLDREDDLCYEALRTLLRKNSSLNVASRHNQSYDFVLSTIFLLLRGDKDKTRQLHDFLCDQYYAYLYFPNIYGTCDTMLCAALCQVFEAVLLDHVPSVYHALRAGRYGPRSVLTHWVGQFFWNVLDFDEIATVLMTLVVFGGDYVLYICASMLRHMESDILEHFNRGRLVTVLRRGAIGGFRLSDNLQFLHGLKEQYRNVISKCFRMYAH